MSGVDTHVEEGLGERLPRIVPGMVSLPLSKSLGLRGLLAAAGLRRSLLMRSASTSGWVELGEDLSSGIQCARALGASISISEDSMAVSWDREPVGGTLPVGESGFIGRVAPTCAALSRNGSWNIEAQGTLLTRSSDPLWKCLEDAGVSLERGDSWATNVSGTQPLSGLTLHDPVSSQELSALLIGLAANGGGSFALRGTIPSRPYLEMTAAVLALFGFDVVSRPSSLRVEGAAVDPVASMVIEVDASAAAVALAAGCLSGVRVEVPAPTHGSLQGDWRIVDYLRAFGCVIEESGSTLVAAGPPLNAVDLDLGGEPDLAPVLAVVAAAAALGGAGSSVLSGLGTLDGKESARGQVLSSGLRAAGFQCEWSGVKLKISGEPATFKPVSLDPESDHRMAFAFALLGVIRENVWVSKGSCILKSWPNFWSSMGS